MNDDIATELVANEQLELAINAVMSDDLSDADWLEPYDL